MSKASQQSVPPARGEKIRAALYLRVSTEEQANDGYGLDVQRVRTRALAASKGWDVAAEFTDAGISGAKGLAERPGLAALFEAVERGKIDAVIVLALDRLGRKTALVLELVERLTAAGVALVSCKESLDSSSPQGSFVLTMFAALAQLERDVIIERTTAGRNERAKIDGEKGGRLPLGYVRSEGGDTLAIDNGAAEVVRLIFSRRERGATLAAIADELNAAGFPTARRSQGYSGRWYASTVRSVLQNAGAYSGRNRGDSAVRWPVIDVN